jgi:hypothetical protein
MRAYAHRQEKPFQQKKKVQQTIQATKQKGETQWYEYIGT